MVRKPKQKNKALILIIVGLLMTTVVLMYLIVSKSPDRAAQIRSAEENKSTSGMTLALPDPADIYLKRALRAEAKQNHLLAIAEYQNALKEQPGQMEWHLRLVKNAAQEYQKRPAYRTQALQHLRNAYNLLDQSNAIALRPSLDSLGQMILQIED